MVAAGYVLPGCCAEVAVVPPVNTPSNCPTEANILSCSQGGQRCPESGCDMLCALSGASKVSVTGYKAYSSSNSASQVSAGKVTIISVIALGEGSACFGWVVCFRLVFAVTLHCWKLLCNVVCTVNTASCLIASQQRATGRKSTFTTPPEQSCLALHMSKGGVLPHRSGFLAVDPVRGLEAEAVLVLPMLLSRP